MDEFDGKRSMVKKLMEMLKSHASNEVSTGLQHPEGEGDMHGLEVEKVEMLPDHEMDISTPEHEVDTKMVPEGQHTASSGYHTGGIVDKVSPIMPPPMDAEMGQPDKQSAVHKELGESLGKRDSLTTTEHEEPLDTEYPEAESEPSSMFKSFLSRKKKK